MFRFVGCIVVTGFALFGLGQFLRNHVACARPKAD
jgi:hypothetical protein